MNLIPNILLTTGEPAGIGPDIIIQIAQEPWDAELIVIADPDLLLQRAKQIGLPLNLTEYDPHSSLSHSAGSLTILPVKLRSPVQAGKLNPENAMYVIDTLTLAGKFCLDKKAQAIVTGPVHKGILNSAGIEFTGHTEFFAELSQVEQTVMLFVVNHLKIALATTHLPLKKVPEAITESHLEKIISILNTDLKRHFQIVAPHILVCGLNPHAGENGYLGREEIEIISPVISKLNSKGYKLEGPLPADTIFTEQHLKRADAILAMYHDQALPLVKYLGFGNAVNVTLGLPYVRTSVDHGSALDIAGKNIADAGSMKAAIQLAIKLVAPN